MTITLQLWAGRSYVGPLTCSTAQAVQYLDGRLPLRVDLPARQTRRVVQRGRITSLVSSS